MNFKKKFSNESIEFRVLGSGKDFHVIDVNIFILYLTLNYK